MYFLVFIDFIIYQPVCSVHPGIWQNSRSAAAGGLYNQTKNDFVTRVLTSYKIPHERNTQGVVVRINMEGKWLNIKTIEIVPVIKEAADKSLYVIAHELFFYTDKDILDLVSELTIR